MSKKIKILHIVPSFNYGGIEQYCLNLFDHIDCTRFEMELFCTSYPSPQHEELEKRNIPYYEFPSTGFYGRIKSYAKLVREKKYDIIHIQGLPNTGVAYLLVAKLVSPGTKCIVHAHMGFRTSFGNKFIRKLAYACCYHATNTIYRCLSDMRAGCTHEAMQIHFGKGIKNKGRLISNGINLTQFHSSRTPRLDTQNIISVARIIDVKNPFFLVDLMSELCKRNKNWHLTWIGTGILEQDIQKTIQAKGLQNNISMIGPRKDIPEQLKNNSLFILPSRHEALGIVLIEAQAAGCVCLASTAVPEISNCGALIRLPLAIGAEKWADEIEKLFKQKTEFPIDHSKLLRYDALNSSADVMSLYEKLVHK